MVLTYTETQNLADALYDYLDGNPDPRIGSDEGWEIYNRLVKYCENNTTAEQAP